MKILIVLLISGFSVAVSAQQVGKLLLDPHTSSLQWTGHAEVGSYAPTGTLSIREGTVHVRNGQFVGATMTIEMKSMQQENAQLLHHLESEDFFDIEHYPVSSLSIQTIDHGTVIGTLTIKDKTEPFQTPIVVHCSASQFTIQGKVKLDRTRYGIVYNSKNFFSGLGDKAISNMFDVEFHLVGNGSLPSQYCS